MKEACSDHVWIQKGSAYISRVERPNNNDIHAWAVVVSESGTGVANKVARLLVSPESVGGSEALREIGRRGSSDPRDNIHKVLIY